MLQNNVVPTGKIVKFKLVQPNYTMMYVRVVYIYTFILTLLNKEYLCILYMYIYCYIV